MARPAGFTLSLWLPSLPIPLQTLRREPDLPGPFSGSPSAPKSSAARSSTAYRMANAGALPVIRRRGGLFVPRQALEKWIEAEAEAALAALETTDGHRAADKPGTNKGPAQVTKHDASPGKDSQ